MGLFSRFENKAQNVIEGGGARGAGGIEPVKLAKRAYKEMQREKMVGVGHEYAPTLYNVLLSPEDDAKMSSYYPSLAGEIETYLIAKAKDAKLVFDCHPLVRFIVDDGLKRGRFDIIAESVSASIISDLRDEELEHYGLKKQPAANPRKTAYWDPSKAAHAEQAHGYDAVGGGEDYHQRDVQPRVQPERPEAGRGYGRFDDYDDRSGYDDAAGNGAYDEPAGYDTADDRRAYDEPAAYDEPDDGRSGYDASGSRRPYDDPAAYDEPGDGRGYAGEWPDEYAYEGEPAPAPSPEPEPAPAPSPEPAAHERHYPPTELPAEQPVRPVPEAGDVADAYGRSTSAAATTLLGTQRPSPQPAPRPAPAPRGTLHEFATGVRHVLEAPRSVIGRGSACDIVVSEPSVSRHHAEILHDETGWIIRDTGSTNGTKVNGSRASQMRIYTGDVIALGNAELEFREE